MSFVALEGAFYKIQENEPNVAIRVISIGFFVDRNPVLKTRGMEFGRHVHLPGRECLMTNTIELH